MRKRVILASLILFLPIMMLAQSGIPNAAYGERATRTTFYGGYSYLRNGGHGFSGWDGQGTFNLNRYLGVTADISGNLNSPNSIGALGFSVGDTQRLNTFLFGPTVTGYFGKNAVFGHALFGAAHSSLGAGVTIPIIGGISAPITSANAFAMEFGGGLDIGLSKHFAIRVAQVDYLRTQFNANDALASGLSSSLGNSQNSMRYSGGIVLRF